MNEWWTAQQAGLVGGVGGAVLGTLGGLMGTAAGMLAPKGKAKGLVLGGFGFFLAAGIAMLACGVVALAVHQPYHVYYPLLLGGGLFTFLFGLLMPVVARRYREAEKRRLDAEEIRRG